MNRLFSVGRVINGTGCKSLVMAYMSSEAGGYQFETLKVSSPAQYVFQVELNRPDKRNAFNMAMWRELPICFEKLSVDPECRVVVVSGAGKIFSAGIDLTEFSKLIMNTEESDPGRKAIQLKCLITKLQGSFVAVEKCSKPVIAAVHSGCIGAAVSLICAADIRYSSKDAFFQIKEVEIGLTADVGVLQWLPKVIGNHSWLREKCMTAAQFGAEEALNVGLISKILPDRDTTVSEAISLATLIASKSPLAVQGTKHALIYARDHSVHDSLEQVATWNQSALQSDDVIKAVTAMMQKQTPTFSKL